MEAVEIAVVCKHGGGRPSGSGKQGVRGESDTLL